MGAIIRRRNTRGAFMKLADRMSRLGTEGAFDVLVRARDLELKGHKVIHMEIGEPDFDTPSNIVNAGVRALQSGMTHYSPSAGIPELRAALAAHASRSRGSAVPPDTVVGSPAAKPSVTFLAT